jgi:hypothetical protein
MPESLLAIGEHPRDVRDISQMKDANGRALRRQ